MGGGIGDGLSYSFCFFPVLPLFAVSCPQSIYLGELSMIAVVSFLCFSFVFSAPGPFN